jgi:cytochrome c
MAPPLVAEKTAKAPSVHRIAIAGATRQWEPGGAGLPARRRFNQRDEKDMNRKQALRMTVALCAVAAAGATWATNEAATDKEAVAMVKKGIAYIKANGKDKGFAAITDRNNKEFHDRDLYLAAHTLDGTCVAHGTNEKMVGKNFIEMKDMDGKEYIKERVSFAQSKQLFWTDYKFNNPTTKKIEPKTAYCERLDDVVVCGGIYKK